MRRLINTVTYLVGIALILGAFYISLNQTKTKVEYGIFHYSSFMLIVLGLLGILFSSNEITKVTKVIGNLIFKSPARLESQLNYLNNNLKKMSGNILFLWSKWIEK